MLNRRHVVFGALTALGLAGCAALDSVPVEGRAKTLINAARAQGRHFVFYDGGYTRIAYPGGDVPPGRGACTDVIIRAYRVLGIDLQKLVHEDMLANFAHYPNLWGLSAPDSNIDHRRVPNLSRFFERFAERLPLSNSASDYRPGDIVAMNPSHIAFVSDHRVRGQTDRLVIIQNNGFGVREDVQDFVSRPFTGHFRYAL
jgi:uncharacterized protein YijF (DUF1287 family)